MRKFFINLIMGALIGLVLSTVGAGAATWQFWAIMACAGVSIWNNQTD